MIETNPDVLVLRFDLKDHIWRRDAKKGSAADSGSGTLCSSMWQSTGTLIGAKLTGLRQPASGRQ